MSLCLYVCGWRLGVWYLTCWTWRWQTHTHVQTQKYVGMLNQPTCNDFHMVTFLLKKKTLNQNTYTHTDTHTQTSCLHSTSFPRFNFWPVEFSLFWPSNIWKGKVNSLPPSLPKLTVVECAQFYQSNSGKASSDSGWGRSAADLAEDIIR